MNTRFAGRDLEFVFDTVLDGGQLNGRLTVNLVKLTPEPNRTVVSVLIIKGNGDTGLRDEVNGQDPIFLHEGEGPLTVVFAALERSLEF